MKMLIDPNRSFYIEARCPGFMERIGLLSQLWSMFSKFTIA